jgi:hypothetical protein
VLVHLTRAGRARHRRLTECLERGRHTLLTPRDAACVQRLAELAAELCELER